MEELNSEFEWDSEAEAGRKRRRDLCLDPKPAHHTKANKAFFEEEQAKDSRRRSNYFVVDAYNRHKEMINNYLLTVPGATKTVLQRDASLDRNDADVIRQNHRFLWEEEGRAGPSNWEQRLAKRYYDKLFKEYCIADLSRYKENKVALRWRVEKEVVEGKGHFVCGARKCLLRQELTTWEVNFAYVEDGSKKSALVKVRLCPDHSAKLNFHHQKRRVEKKPKKAKRRRAEEEEEEWRESKPTSSKKAKEEPSTPSSSGAAKAEPATPTREEETKAWEGPVQLPDEDKSRDEEIDEFLEDLFF